MRRFAHSARRAVAMGLGIGLGLALPAAAQESPAPDWAAPPEIAAQQGENGSPGADFPEGNPVALAALSESGDVIERAWRARAGSLEERVFEARRRSLEVGAWNLAPAARILIRGRGTASIEQSRAAVELAPDMPAAHMELAAALWLEGEAPVAALRSAFDAALAAGRHPEASFWFLGSGLYLLAAALVGGGIGIMLLAGLGGLPHAAHDLGHGVPGRLPEYARFALLAGLLLAILAAGEGLLGLALALAAIASLSGGAGRRTAMLLAAVGVGLGAHPVAQGAGALLEAFPLDPVARAAATVGEGLASPVELARLRQASANDPLAARGLAIHARRHGRLAEADALYQRLLEEASADVATLNNAANVRLDLGHIERALELYEQALAVDESPVVLFNLAQAYGRGFMVEDLNRTFARAQKVGGDLVADLTALQGTDAEGFVVDFPLSRELFWARALRPGAGAAVAAELRERVAPGRLGQDPRWLLGAIVLAVGLGSLAGARISPSRWCARCGVRVCPRCDPQNTAGEICEGCRRLFHQPEKTDRAMRLQRVKQLEARDLRMARVHSLLSVVLPGAAGLLSKSGLRAWLGSVCFALALAAWIWREGLVPDPLVAGTAGPIAFGCVGVMAAIGYALVVGTSLASRRAG